MLLMLCLAAIGISSVDPRYFADESGKTWVPIGCNICFDRHSNASAKTRELFDDWMVKFAANGGNYMRVWLSVPFVDVMPDTAYEFSAEATGNLKWLVSRAEALGIKLKFTLENFRYLGPKTDLDPARGRISFRSTVYAPYAKTMREVFTLPECFDIYLAKARHIAECGAVERRHAGMSHLCMLDKDGMMLHDQIFAPFFAGSAGCGRSVVAALLRASDFRNASGWVSERVLQSAADGKRTARCVPTCRSAYLARNSRHARRRSFACNDTCRVGRREGA